MSKAYKWHQIAFIKELNTLLGHISGDNINYLEFRLLAEQAGLVFVSQEQEKRCQNLFQKCGFISKIQFVSSIALVDIETKHCRRYYVVRLRPTSHEIEHQGKRCFHFWIDLMQQKYGPTHGWFELLCQERDVRRVTIQNFKLHLNRVLKGTLHEQCAQKISMLFQKSKRNQIEVTVFTNTLRIHRKLLSKTSGTITNLKDSLPMSCQSPVKHRTETKATSAIFQTKESFGKSARSNIWSAGSARTRYLTPSRFKLVTKKYSILSFK